jgi:hypothetical protein
LKLGIAEGTRVQWKAERITLVREGKDSVAVTCELKVKCSAPVDIASLCGAVAVTAHWNAIHGDVIDKDCIRRALPRDDMFMTLDRMSFVPA